MINIKRINFAIFVLDWVSLLLSYYNIPAEELPKNVKSMIKGASRPSLNNGIEKFYCNCALIKEDDIQDVFTFRYPAENNKFKYSTIIITKKMHYSSRYYLYEPIVMDKDDSIPIIILPIEALSVKTNSRLFVQVSTNLIHELLCKPKSIVTGFEYFERIRYKLLMFFIQFVFIRGVLSGSEYEKYWNLSDTNCDNSKISVYDFIKDTYNFNNVSMTQVLKEGVQKFISGDIEFWEGLTAKINWDNIVPNIPDPNTSIDPSKRHDKKEEADENGGTSA